MYKLHKTVFMFAHRRYLCLLSWGFRYEMGSFHGFRKWCNMFFDGNGKAISADFISMGLHPYEEEEAAPAARGDALDGEDLPAHHLLQLLIECAERCFFRVECDGHLPLINHTILCRQKVKHTKTHSFSWCSIGRQSASWFLLEHWNIIVGLKTIFKVQIAIWDEHATFLVVFRLYTNWVQVKHWTGLEWHASRMCTAYLTPRVLM